MRAAFSKQSCKPKYEQSLFFKKALFKIRMQFVQCYREIVQESTFFKKNSKRLGHEMDMF